MSASGVVETERTSTGQVALSSISADGDAKQLDNDVQFMGIETLVDARNALEIQKSGETVPMAGVGTAVSGGISSPLLVYPDGSSTTAQIILADSRGRRMAIQLRGVTGRSSIVRLATVDASSIPAIANAAPSKGGW
jgi:hypothetical protein